jgi:hypothetical protein
MSDPKDIMLEKMLEKLSEFLGKSKETQEDNLFSRSALAQSMAAPLRQRLDYKSIGRRVFNIDPLPDFLFEFETYKVYKEVDEDGYHVVNDDEIVLKISPDFVDFGVESRRKPSKKTIQKIIELIKTHSIIES